MAEDWEGCGECGRILMDASCSAQLVSTLNRATGVSSESRCFRVGVVKAGNHRGCVGKE
jgi:hypothetical protein